MAEETHNMNTAPGYGSLDAVIGLPEFYGHYVDPVSDEAHKSDEIEASLLQLSEPNPALHTALQAIFTSPEWMSQTAPVDVNLLRDNNLRVKEKDEAGKDWWPCQLGCPDGIPLTLRRTKLSQATHATEHIEWHLGLKRFACSICLLTFTRAKDRDSHEDLHRDPKNLPCEYGCGFIFPHDKPGNRTRHYQTACPNNPNRAPGRGVVSSASGSSDE
ncbi:hypothetical protein M408DRAFT_308270 [Serendipita vermifera MAFF 305830]|uniref:C2H2-type domain-containing protein n=1 Tax=Serendipita vermifera MAFF 305830 TaxID=933852 RepID=A0A0C2WQ57_SERVB|nr:hypothetical protein M408DRAFT_308270 [Serendipita vermifera MAFF 305830]